jgi:hypothetical protein
VTFKFFKNTSIINNLLIRRFKMIEFEKISERIGAATEEWLAYNRDENPEIIES